MSDHTVLKDPEAVLTIGSFLFENTISGETEVTGVGGSITYSTSKPDIDTTTQNSPSMKFTQGKTDPGSLGFTLYYNADDPMHVRLQELGTQSEAGAGNQTWVYAKPVGIGKDASITPFEYTDYLANVTFLSFAKHSGFIAGNFVNLDRYNATVTTIKGGVGTWASDGKGYPTFTGFGRLDSTNALSLDEATYDATVVRLLAGENWVDAGSGENADGVTEVVWDAINAQEADVNADGVDETDFNNILVGNDILSEANFDLIRDDAKDNFTFENDPNTSTIDNRGSRTLTDEQKQTDENGIARIDYDKVVNTWQAIIAVPYEVRISRGFVSQYDEDNDVNGVVSVNVSIRLTGRPTFIRKNRANVTGSALRDFVLRDNVRNQGGDLVSDVNPITL